MVALGGLITVHETVGPTKVNRFNSFPAADLNGVNIPLLVSSGAAIDKMELLANRELPPGMTISWADMAFQQKKAASTEIRIPGPSAQSSS